MSPTVICLPFHPSKSENWKVWVFQNIDIGVTIFITAVLKSETAKVDVTPELLSKNWEKGKVETGYFYCGDVRMCKAKIRVAVLLSRNNKKGRDKIEEIFYSRAVQKKER